MHFVIYPHLDTVGWINLDYNFGELIFDCSCFGHKQVVSPDGHCWQGTKHNYWVWIWLNALF